MKAANLVMILAGYAACLAASSALAQEPASPAPPLPDCSYEDRDALITPAGDGRHSVLDTVFRLPATWEPSDLVPIRESGFEHDGLIRLVAIADLTQLRQAAEAEGIQLQVFSAYRSYAYQATTFDYWVDRYGAEEARRVSARPGHSEHQLGTAVDLGTRNGPAPWDVADWAQTPAGAWMQENGWRFGFMPSYPIDSLDLTCYDYEPWHWRWVGREVTAAALASTQPLRVYLWERQATMLEEATDDP